MAIAIPGPLTGSAHGLDRAGGPVSMRRESIPRCRAADWHAAQWNGYWSSNADSPLTLTCSRRAGQLSRSFRAAACVPGTDTPKSAATPHKPYRAPRRYVVTLPDGTETDEAEDVFSTLEGRAVTAISALVDRRIWPIPASVRRDIARWVALQYLRVPWVRRLGREIAEAFSGTGVPVRTGGGRRITAPWFGAERNWRSRRLHRVSSHAASAGDAIAAMAGPSQRGRCSIRM